MYTCKQLTLFLRLLGHMFCTENVGKTSIIEVLITEKFQEQVQPVLPVLVVPKDVTPEHVHVSIVDTPGDSEQVSKVEAELQQADVIVLVYAVDDGTATNRVISHWLPKFRAMSLNVPVVLVGNKIDVRGGVADPEAASKMEAFIKPIMDRFREVDVCIECSAKTVSNISEVFYFAQKAVLYPTGPVYNVETHSLRPKAVAALRRIFKLCDKDGDGGLNDRELNDFQYKCFSVHLQPAELEGVKKVVKENRPTDGLNADDSLSVEGFIYLHTLFVQKGRLETTWIVLRRFGYDDDMRLKVEVKDLPKVGEGQSVELSDKGKEFLVEMFRSADKDGDGYITNSELKDIFAECIDGPFAVNKLKNQGPRLVRNVQVNGKGDCISLDAFISRWCMFVIDSVEDAMRSLLYLGYREELHSAVLVTKSRRRDRNARSVSREVIQVGVMGLDGPIKTDVVRGLVGYEPRFLDQVDVMAAARKSDGENEKVLILRSLGSEEEGKLLTERGKIDDFDIVCIVFDVASQESFEKGLEVWHALEERKSSVKMPVVFVGAFGEDVTSEGTDVLNMADEFCLEQKLPTPTRVSVSDGDYGQLYEDLLGVAIYPQVACPDYYYDEDAPASSTWVTAGKLTLGVVVIGGAVYGAKKVYDYYTSKPKAS